MYCCLTFLKAHTGPINLRLRIHLPLIIPTGNGKCGIRVGSQQRSWMNGKALVLDDSYEHEVWNYTRYVVPS
jgi:aspartyl/asparaginyl beta-hydroxylase (cupin superfamily)